MSQKHIKIVVNYLIFTINHTIEFSKKKNRFEFQKNFNFLQLCDFCIATYDKNQNKSNYEIWQTFFNVAKMN